MLPDRKLRISVGILLISLALLALYFMPDKTLSYWTGILLGGITGGVTIVYMMLNKVVNPEQAKSTFRESRISLDNNFRRWRHALGKNDYSKVVVRRTRD